MQDDREKLRAAGFSDAEIEQALGPARPTVQRAATESTTATNGKAPSAGIDWDAVRGTVRALGNGATWGMADNAIGNVRGALGMHPGENEMQAHARRIADLQAGRSSSEDRNALMAANRADAQATTRQFQEEHPKTALAANVAGGLLSGRMVPALESMQVASPFARGGKIANAAATGALTGGVSAAGSAEGSIGDRVKKGALGAVLGAAGGATIAGAGSLAATAGRNVKTIAKGANATTSDEQVADRLLRLAQRSGRKIDDIAGGDDIDMVAERLGDAGKRTLGSAYRRGYAQPEKIAETLNDRAASETGRLIRRAESLTGSSDVDPATFTNRALESVKPRVAKFSKMAARQPDVDSPEIGEVLADLMDMGETGIVKRARKLAIGRNSLAPDQSPTTTISVRNLQFLRRAIDRRVEELKMMNPPDMELVDILGARRGVVDDVLKQAGGKAQQKADALWAQANGEAESFASGAGVHRAGDSQAVTRLQGEARDGEAFRKGAAGAMLKRLKNVQDEGVVSDPAPRLFGGETRRAQSRAGFANDADFEQLREAGRNVSARFQTKRDVIGNSATAQRLADDADAGGIGEAAINAAQHGPLSAAWALAKKGLAASQRRATGAEMDALAPYLMAGAPGSTMTREQVRDFLKAMEPSLRRMYQQRAGMVGTASGLGAGGAVGRR